MILDPDAPLPQARTDRQSLIRTERGWAVLGQPTKAAEAWVKSSREEIAAMLTGQPDREIERVASVMAHDFVARGLLADV